jgi:hypothetical protein
MGWERPVGQLTLVADRGTVRSDTLRPSDSGLELQGQQPFLPLSPTEALQPVHATGGQSAALVPGSDGLVLVDADAKGIIFSGPTIYGVIFYIYKFK